MQFCNPWVYVCREQNRRSFGGVTPGGEQSSDYESGSNGQHGPRDGGGDSKARGMGVMNKSQGEKIM